MFTYKNNEMKFPLKIWLDDKTQIEDDCLEQAEKLASLPFVHKWVCLMPDTHTGMGMPIGGVIATTGVIIPNAVGVDIGCGMAYVETNIKFSEVKDIETGNGTFIQALVGNIMRNIPVGFNSHKTKQQSSVLDNALKNAEKYSTNPSLFGEIENGYYQVGTLGGGNHFIEIQEGDDGLLGIMIHSGSRHFGKKICDYYHKLATHLNQEWYSSIPSSWQLSFLPICSTHGKEYIEWMNLALDYAYENRATMLSQVKNILQKMIEKYTDKTIEFTTQINCHHNYAAIENHYDMNVWVHRKGATRARLGELAVIPGAMGSYSYIVEGLGNAESFCSSSHGAGRQYSRKGATLAFSVEQVISDLKKQGVTLGKHNKSDVAEESRFAYKDIEKVMENQSDLVKIVKRLKTVGVVKG